MAAPYVYLKIPGHPLAASNGKVRKNRAVLYEKIGPGPHQCHWCGMTVRWMSGFSACYGGPPDMLVADHIDDNTRNDDPSNLVPACGGCNRLRSRGWRIISGALVVVDRDGTKHNAIELRCEKCGIRFTSRPRTKSGPRRFCSRKCAIASRHPDRIERICEVCGKSFVKPPGRLKYEPARYCSRECRSTSQKGVPVESRAASHQKLVVN